MLNKISPRTKKILIAVFLSLLTLTSATLSYFYLKYSKMLVKSDTIKPTEGIAAAATSDDFDFETSYNVLLLGYGGPGHDGAYLSDTLIVANINTENKKVTLISVPRDLWLPIPIDWDITAYHKINAAYAIGGDEARFPNKKPEFRGEFGRGELAKHAAGIVVGMPVKHFIAVDFRGLEKAVDLIGGVEVDVPKTFNDYFYPIKGLENETCGFSPEKIRSLHEQYSGSALEKQFACRYEHLYFEKGKQFLSGTDALKFVRSRNSGEHGGDFARSERQHALLVGIKNKIVSLGIVAKFDPLIDKLVGSVKTDISLSNLKTILTTHPDITNYEVRAIQLTDQNYLRASTGPGGQFILIPREGQNKWDSIHRFIQENIGL